MSQCVLCRILTNIQQQRHKGNVQMVKRPNTTQIKQFDVNATTSTPSYSQAELAIYHHQCLGNPRKETILRVLRKHPTQFETFLGLCNLRVNKYPFVTLRGYRKGSHDFDKESVKVDKDYGQENSQS